jgi:hypothetical protein
MKLSPMTKAFVFRVGGFFSLVLCAIVLAKRFYPGYEAVASSIVCLIAMIVVMFEYLQKRRLRRRRTKRRI